MNSYTFRRVSASEYYEGNNIIRLVDYEGSNRYWLLTLSGTIFGFSTNDEYMIDPLIEYFKEDEIIFIGIHDRVLAFSTQGTLKFFAGLWNLFTTVEKVNLGYLVVSDTSFLKVNATLFSVDKVIMIPDVIQSYKIDGNRILIKGLEGEIFEVYI